MLEITRIRTDKDSIIEGLKKRNIDATETIEKIISTDLNWRNNKTELEGIAAELNQLAKEIGELFKQGKQQEANEAKNKTATLKVTESELKSAVDELEKELEKNTTN